MNRKNNFRNLYISIFLVLFSLLIILPSVASAPIILIEEFGNITYPYDNNVTGTIQLDDDYGYRAFSAMLNDFHYYNSSVPKHSSHQIEYSRNFNENFFKESIQFFTLIDELTIRYNLSNSFNSSIDVEMIIPFPSVCEYIDHTIYGTSDFENVENNNLELEFTMPENSYKIINATCLSTGGNVDFFPSAQYNIKTIDILKEYRFSVLPKSFFSTTKQIIGIEEETSGFGVLSQNTTWRAGFEFTNADDIPLEITNINLWAVPMVNVTNDPKENAIFDMNYTECLNTNSNIVEKDDVCVQQDTFESHYVPVIWSEVSYNVIWEFMFTGNYYFQGNSSIYDFDFFRVELTSPENNSYVDFEEKLDLEFNVTQNANCELYSNITGVWQKESNPGLYNVTEGSFEVTTFNETGNFVWNVLCIDVNGFMANYARNNNTINVNALQELYNEIPYLEWPQFTNYTLNMSDYFRDFENDHLNYTHYPNPVANISFIVDNTTGTIVLSPDHYFYGERTAQIISVDPYGREVNSNLFLMNVTYVYLPPEIIFWNITNGTWWTTNETYIEAPVNTTLNFTADAVHPQFPSPIPGSWFYWFIDGVLQEIGRFFSWYIDFFQIGERNVTLVVNDTFGMYDYQTWIINATRIDVPPQVKTIPDMHWKQNTTFTLNLTEWFYDIYRLDDNFTFSYEGHFQNLSLELDNDINVININPDTNWLGINKSWMIITAKDKYNFTTVSNNFSLSVYPWIIKQIPNVTFFVDGWNDTINLSKKYNTENYALQGFTNYTWQDLFWSAFAPNLDFILNPVTGILNITSINGWVGNQTVVMKVNNSFGWYDNTEFNVEVLPFNHPPEINDTDYYMVQNTSFEYGWIDLWEISYDPDNTHDELNFDIISQSNTSLMVCEVSENRYINCTDPVPELWGNTSLNVSVNDGYLYDYAIINIIVEKYITPPDINNWNITSENFFIEMADLIYNLEFYENQTLQFQVNTTDRENRELTHYWWFNETLISTTMNSSIYFDFHSSGNYTVHYFVNNSEGGYAELFWNLTVVNNNRPPYPVELISPINGSFINDYFWFNWTNTTDPDAERHNEDDYWDFVYILQVSKDYNFQNKVIDIQFKNITSYFLDTLIPDGWYYWRVLAFDGADTSSSEIWEFGLDINPPEVTLEIIPSKVEFGIRNVTINWSAYDLFLENAYVNVTYPNGTLLGTYYSNITLTPDELILPGDYGVLLYAIDLSNNTAIIQKEFSVVEDLTPPQIELIEPSDNVVVASNTGVFVYAVDDINHPYECSLYLQNLNIIYDMVGGIMHKSPPANWVKVLTTRNARLGQNYFIYAPLVEDSYIWNVECVDYSGNVGYADKNFTFRVLLREDPIVLPTYPIDETRFEERVTPGYSLRARTYSLDAFTGEKKYGLLELENVGQAVIYDLSFLPSVDWVEFSETISFLEPGDRINVSYVVRSPVYPGEYIYHIGLVSNNINQLVSGHINVVEDADVPLRVEKSVYKLDDYYEVRLRVINYLKYPLNIYIEDSIYGMEDIIFSHDDFITTGTTPPYLALSRSRIFANETLEVSYRAQNIDISSLRKPIILTNVDFVSTLEVVSPHYFNVLLFRKTPMEIILIVVSLVIFVLSILYSYFYDFFNRYQNF